MFEKNVELECPKCGTHNAIPQPWGIKCQKCNAPLGKGRYKTRLISAWGAFFFGIGGAVGVSQYLETDRYPIQVEHSIIESCISDSRRPLAYSNILKKRDICICALEETQKDSELTVDGNKNIGKKFIDAFEDNANHCIKDL